MNMGKGFGAGKLVGVGGNMNENVKRINEIRDRINKIESHRAKAVILSSGEGKEPK